MLSASDATAPAATIDPAGGFAAYVMTMARGESDPTLLPLTAQLPTAHPAAPAVDDACAYWGEEACGRRSTYAIDTGQRDPIAACDLHVGALTSWDIGQARREGRPLAWVQIISRA